MLDLVLVVLVMGAAVAAASVTLSLSKAFAWLRDWVDARSEFWGNLLGCPYCVSHWFALAAVALGLDWRLLGMLGLTPAVWFFVVWLAVVGAAGFFTHLITGAR